jgi:hypothetical protein
MSLSQIGYMHSSACLLLLQLQPWAILDFDPGLLNTQLVRFTNYRLVPLLGQCVSPVW